MAFFSELKAKLGLDIGEFERGMSKAQQGVGELGSKMGKQIAGTEKIGSTLATALGINLQSIAEGVARFWIGSSKEAEAALEEQVKMSEIAANKQVKQMEAVRDKQASLRASISKQNTDKQWSGMSPAQQVVALITEREQQITKLKKGDVTQRLEAENRILEIEKQIEEISVKITDEAGKEAQISKDAADAKLKAQDEWFAKQKTLAEQLASNEFKAAEDTRKMKAQAAYDAYTDEQKLQVLQKRGRDAQALADETGLEEDKLAVEKIKQEVKDLKSGKGGTTGAKSDRAAGDNSDLVTGTGEGDRTMNAKGQLMRRGAVVSREDALRSQDTSVKNEAHSEVAESNKILTEILGTLIPTTS